MAGKNNQHVYKIKRIMDHVVRVLSSGLVCYRGKTSEICGPAYYELT